MPLRFEPEKRSGGPGRPLSQRDRDMARFVRLGAVGIELVVAVGLFGLVGWLVDRWAGTKPAFLLVGLGVGFAGGMYRFIREGLAANRPRKPGR